MQVEDRRANLLDYLLEIIHALGQPLLHFGGPCPRDGSLQGEPHGEEPLDDVIVKISCDAIPIGQDVELPTSATEFSQLRAYFRGHDTRSALTRGESPGLVRSSPL